MACPLATRPRRSTSKTRSVRASSRLYSTRTGPKPVARPASPDRRTRRGAARPRDPRPAPGGGRLRNDPASSGDPRGEDPRCEARAARPRRPRSGIEGSPSPRPSRRRAPATPHPPPRAGAPRRRGGRFGSDVRRDDDDFGAGGSGAGAQRATTDLTSGISSLRRASMPILRVIEELGQPAHAPCRTTSTTPSR